MPLNKTFHYTDYRPHKKGSVTKAGNTVKVNEKKTEKKQDKKK